MSTEPIPIIRPTLPDLNVVRELLEPSYNDGLVTTGSLVKTLELEIKKYTGSSHAVAVSSCTSGLMLAYAAMNFPEGSEVILPSFTFAATAQAILWNRLTPVYVDCLPATMTIDPKQVIEAISPSTAAICPVTIFGLPPDISELVNISKRYAIPLIFDSAQGLGAKYKDRRLGAFGLCEVFSMSPTKVITAIEAGVLTTNNTELADKMRSLRDYGKGPDGQEMIYIGLSARLSELHAAVGLSGISNADSLINSRLRLIRSYRDRLGGLPGCSVQTFPDDRTSSGNYFTLLIGPNAKIDREAVYDALKAQNIQSKRYFYPPVHAQTAFRNAPGRVVGALPNTVSASHESLALPLFSHMTEEQQDRICRVIESALS